MNYSEKDLEIAKKITRHLFFPGDIIQFEKLHYEIAQALSAQRLETLKLPEMQRILAYSDHTYFCQSKDGECECGYGRARKDFDALLAKLEPKEDKSK